MHPDVASALINQRARDDLVEIAAILKAKRELADREQGGPVPPTDARAFIEQRSHELIEEIKAKLAARQELADSEKEGAVDLSQEPARKSEGASHE